MKKKTNKFSKGKTIGIVAASLAAVSLIGVGFSTWIIQTKTDATVSDISVTVADTKDISVAITDAAVDSANNSVKFDADNTKKVDDSILSCETSDTEDLSFAITYKVTLGENVGKWQIKAAVEDTTDGKFNTAVNTRKYITMPAKLGITTGNECLNQDSATDAGSGLTVTKGDKDATTKKTTITVTQTFTFGWGEAFASKNPVAVTKTDTIYDQDGASVTADVDNLSANTKALKALGLESFNVTLSVGTVDMASNS